MQRQQSSRYYDSDALCFTRRSESAPRMPFHNRAFSSHRVGAPRRRGAARPEEHIRELPSHGFRSVTLGRCRRSIWTSSRRRHSGRFLRRHSLLVLLRLGTVSTHLLLQLGVVAPELRKLLRVARLRRAQLLQLVPSSFGGRGEGQPAAAFRSYQLLKVGLARCHLPRSARSGGAGLREGARRLGLALDRCGTAPWFLPGLLPELLPRFLAGAARLALGTPNLCPGTLLAPGAQRVQEGGARGVLVELTLGQIRAAADPTIITTALCVDVLTDGRRRCGLVAQQVRVVIVGERPVDIDSQQGRPRTRVRKAVSYPMRLNSCSPMRSVSSPPSFGNGTCGGDTDERIVRDRMAGEPVFPGARSPSGGLGGEAAERSAGVPAASSR